MLMTSAIALSAGMTAMTAYAEDAATTYTLTVDAGDVATRTYEVYQIFKGDLHGDVLSNLVWGDGITSEGQTQLGVASTYAGGITEANAPTKATELSKYLNSAKAKKVGAKAGDSNANVAELNNLEAGYYLIKDVSDFSNKEDANSRYLLKVVKNETVSPKKDVPTLDKNIIEGTTKTKANTANIGDKIDFQLDSKVPDMTGYNKYFFIVNDTMEKGLTFNNDVAITVGDKTLEEGTDFSVETSGNNFEIVFMNFIQYNSTEYKGKEIKINYSATLNENADFYNDSNDNTVSLTFSNNPNHEYKGIPDEPGNPGNPNKPGTEDKNVTGKTPDEVTKTYTTGLKLTKVDGADSTKKLAGATFRLSGEGITATVVNGTYYKLDSTGTFYMLKDGSFTDTAPATDTSDKYASTEKYKKVTESTEITALQNIVTEATSGPDGVIEFKGIKPGTYTLTEIKQPDGYNKLAEPLKVVITGNATNSEAWTATVGSKTATLGSTSNLFETEIENNKGATLPGTGGIGTALFYTAGTLLIAGGATLLITKKRMNVKEK